MRSSSREEVEDAFDMLHAAVSRACGLSFDALTTPERLTYLERLEQEARRIPVPGHALINQVARQTTRDEIGGKLSHVLADRLRITRAQAARRIDEAEDLGTRQAVTGEPLPPRLPAVSAAQRTGAIGVGHVSVIRRFLRELPCWVDIETRSQAEAQLAACC